jgi:hypothetical protein
MPALVPIPPAELRCILEMDGYKILSQDEFNWVLAKGETDVPIILPKKGDLVSLEILMDTLDKAKMNDGTYFRYKSAVSGKMIPPSVTPDPSSLQN